MSGKNNNRRNRNPSKQQKSQLEKRAPQKQQNQQNQQKLQQEQKKHKPQKTNFGDKEIVHGASSLLLKVQNDPFLKVSDQVVPFNNNIVLKDISLRVKGAQEDTQFAQNRGLYTNIRRGNTIAVINNPEGEKTIKFARKGLRKFFDLFLGYIDHNEGKLAGFEGIGVRSVNDHKQLHSYIFKDIEKFFMNRMGSIVVYETRKANGENCQVSWMAESSSWVIASKNVCLLARQKADVELYTESMYHFAGIIANTWFDILEKLNETQISAIKACLTKHTLVGEYTGNPNFQHLVRYDKVRLFFYAVVDNEGTIDALPPAEGFQKIKELGLDCVDVIEHEGCTNHTSLNATLRKIYEKTSVNTLEAGEEGAVLYLAKRYNNDDESFISCCKLKTIEYRIYRKLREKLRNFLSRSNANKVEILEKLNQEVVALIGEHTLRRSAEDYSKLAEMAFTFAETYPNDSYLIHKAYVTFMSILEYCFVNEKNLHPGYFNTKTTEALLANPWSSYKNSQAIPEPSSEKSEAHRQRIIVVVPLTFPGVGKSHLFVHSISPISSKLGFTVKSVSSDEIRRGLMDKIRSQHPLLDDNELFNRTRKTGNVEFDRALSDLLRKAGSVEGDLIVYVDKNHPPNGIKKTVATIRRSVPKNVDLRIMALLPTDESFIHGEGEDKLSYPFGIDMWVQSLVSVQLRRDHPTLNSNGVESAGVMLMFYNLFKNFAADVPSLQALGVHGIIPISFFKKSDLGLGEETTEIFVKLLKGLKPGDKTKDRETLELLLTKLQDLMMRTTSNREDSAVQSKQFEDAINRLPEDAPELPKPESKVQTQAAATEPEKIQVVNEVQKYPISEYLGEATSGNDLLLRAMVDTPPKEVKSEKSFRPKKLPIFLGVFTSEEEETKKRINGLLKYVSAMIATKHGCQLAASDHDDFASEMKTWKWPASHHITTYFVGKEKAKTTSQSYKEFQEGLNFPFTFKHVIYIPNKICTAIVFLDKEKISIENKFPHMTLATGEFTPKQSNEILSTVFGGFMLQSYEAGLPLGAGAVINLNVEIASVFESVYLVELPQQLAFGASTKAYCN